MVGFGSTGEPFASSRSSVPLVLNPLTDFESAESSYLRKDVAVVDALLSVVALEELLEFCRRATIWHDAKQGGYLGAYWRDGFDSPLLAQMAEEMRASMPRVFESHHLRGYWGYKYAADSTGIRYCP